MAEEYYTLIYIAWKGKRTMAFSKETTILCVGCTEKEIRIIKQNLPNKNIQIAETEIAFELYVIPIS